ncbi:hypothetical protein [Deinococcus sp. PESE-13]
MTAEATAPGPRARAYHEYLAAEGYRPQFDGDGDVEFKAEGFYLCCFANEDDPQYLYLAAPNVWALEDAGERTQALDIAMHLQMLYKGLKVVVLSDTVWMSYQGFLEDETAFRGVLGRVIDLLLTGVRDFHRRMREETLPTEEQLGEHGGVQA